MDYSCHLIFPKNPPPVIVRRWISETSYKDILFVGSEKPDKNMKDVEIVYESLFIDDPIQRTLLKILHLLDIKGEKLLPYSWGDEGPMRFKFLKNPPEEYNVNPYFSKMKSPPEPDIQQIGDKIVPYNMLEFTTYSDFIKHFGKKSANFVKYYFPNENDIVHERDIAFVIKDNAVLLDLWRNSPINMHETLIGNNICNYSRAYFEDRLLVPITNYKDLFNKINAGNTIPFIQLCDDVNNIYYKVKQNHKIPIELFEQWTDMSEVPTKHSLIFYSFLNDKQSYMKMVLTQGTDIHIVYRIHSTDMVNYSTIDKHLTKIQAKLKAVGIDIEPTVDRLAVKTSISLPEINLTGISQVFTKYGTIFKFDGGKKNITDKALNFMFIRVEKFGEPTDLINYIRDRLSVHVSVQDIILELNEYGIERDEIIDYVNQINDEDTDMIKKVAKGKRNFSNKGLIITLTKRANELGIVINNASSFTEIQNALFWIRCCVIRWATTKKKEPEAKKKAVVTKAPTPVPSEPSSPSPQQSLQGYSTVSSLEGSMSGGAADKKHNRYLMTQLEAHDPTLFKDKDSTYSRRCAASAKRQPVVMTIENKNAIDKMGYSDGYDNYIIYGSEPSKQNVYMCPRVYCPVSRVPISSEKFKAGMRCPKEKDGETPILLYEGTTWKNNIDVPHYVGFLKKTNKNDMHMPCCFGLKQDDLEEKLKGEATAPPAEKGYIIDKMDRLSAGRLGSIPNSLHDIIHKDIPYKLCKGSVKGTECMLRRGIEKTDDSLMESLSYLLNFETKEALCNAIKKQLDPFTFLTLENGDVYTYFAPTKPIFPQNNMEKRIELKKWLKEHKAYTKLYALNDVIEYLEEKDVPDLIMYKISRQLAIHVAYTRFLDYLYSSEKTSPYMLFDLIHHMGALLIVWDRENENIVTVRSPYSPKNKLWYNGFRNIPYVMVMQHSTYYEPLVLVDQHKNVIQKVPFIHFDRLTQLISVFPVMMKNEDKQIQNLYNLKKWIATVLSQSGSFKLDRLVIDPNDKAIGCFLHNNLYIDFKEHPLSAFSLKNTVSLCNINKLVYWEDILNIEYNIDCNIYDLRLLEDKLTKLDLILVKGRGIQTDESSLQSTYKMPPIMYAEPPKIPLVIKDRHLYDDSKWEEIKKAILTRLVSEYDSLVLPLLKSSKENMIEKLYKKFKDLDEPSHTAVILEELPLTDKDLLKKELQRLNNEKPYYNKDKIVHDDKKHKQWIFSQKAVLNNLIEDVKYPTNIRRPKNYPKESDEIVVSKRLAEPIKIPDFLNPSKLIRTNIPSKWRSKKFREYEIGTLKNYSRDSLIQLFEWVAQQKEIEFDINDLNIFLRAQVNNLLGSKDTYETVLEDPYLREEWSKRFKGRTINEIIKNGFEKASTFELRQTWINISRNTPNRMFQDLDLYNISELLHVNFLILQKGKDVRKGAGNLEELAGSSKFISNLDRSQWSNLPLFIFFKDISKDKTPPHFVYSILLKKDEPSYFKFGYLVPDDIKNVIELHIRKQQRT